MIYGQTAKIPGISLRLTRDPLQTEVSFTEAAKRELNHRWALRCVLEDYFYPIYHTLNTFKPGVDDPSAAMFEALDNAKRLIHKWMPGTPEAEAEDDNSYEMVLRLGRLSDEDDLVQWVNNSHLGDCTAFAAPCARCHIEHLLGIRTAPVDKHLGYRLERVWFNSKYVPEDAKPKTKKHGDMFKLGSGPEWDRAREVFNEHQRRYEEQEANGRE